jgi:hypothetical protein
MTNKQVEEYPVVEKVIQLEPSERLKLQRSMTIASSVKDTILDMLIKACTKIQDRQDAEWDAISQRFGYKSINDVIDSGRMIEISYATSQINLRSRVGNESATL